jgi:hypothetical protein
MPPRIDPFWEACFGWTLAAGLLLWLPAVAVVRRSRRWAAWILLAGTACCVIAAFFADKSGLVPLSTGLPPLAIIGLVQAVVGACVIWRVSQVHDPEQMTRERLAARKSLPPCDVQIEEQQTLGTVCWVCGEPAGGVQAVRLLRIVFLVLVAGGESVQADVPVCVKHRAPATAAWTWLRFLVAATGVLGAILSLSLTGRNGSVALPLTVGVIVTAVVARRSIRRKQRFWLHSTNPYTKTYVVRFLDETIAEKVRATLRYADDSAPSVPLTQE